jgi:hypothetical protein
MTIREGFMRAKNGKATKLERSFFDGLGSSRTL